MKIPSPDHSGYSQASDAKLRAVCRIGLAQRISIGPLYDEPKIGKRLLLGYPSEDYYDVVICDDLDAFEDEIHTIGKNSKRYYNDNVKAGKVDDDERYSDTVSVFAVYEDGSFEVHTNVFMSSVLRMFHIRGNATDLTIQRGQSPIKTKSGPAYALSPDIIKILGLDQEV